MVIVLMRLRGLGFTWVDIWMLANVDKGIRALMGCMGVWLDVESTVPRVLISLFLHAYISQMNGR
jgi:hypothetical protein